MQVMAFSTPAHPKWRWRLMDYAGQITEESCEYFANIAAAVAAGTEQVARMRVTDRSELVSQARAGRRPRS